MDYESKELTPTEIDIIESGFLYREDNKITFKESISGSNELLLQITKSDIDSTYELITNDCKLDEDKNLKSLNNCWFAFRKSRLEDKSIRYKIQQGDIIRFGRITTRVKEIVYNKKINIEKNKFDDNDNQHNKDYLMKKKTASALEGALISTEQKNKNKLINNNSEFITSNKNNSEKINKSITINMCLSNRKCDSNKKPKICKICYGEQDPLSDFDNPLVQPCHCSGSMKYIHLNCLKHWIMTKSCTKIEHNSNYMIFLTKQVECELCKTKFSDYIKHKDQLYELLDFKSEFENYITIESLTIDKNNHRCIYVINLSNNIKIKIGRGQESNLILSDISVSRIHSILTVENKNIFLQDNNSKFGTLVLVQSPSIKIIDGLPLYIQIGRSFLECSIKKKSSFFSCCGVYEKPNNNYYFLQNEQQLQVNLFKMFTIRDEIDISEDNIDNNENNFGNDIISEEKENMKNLNEKNFENIKKNEESLDKKEKSSNKNDKIESIILESEN